MLYSKVSTTNDVEVVSGAMTRLTTFVLFLALPLSSCTCGTKDFDASVYELESYSGIALGSPFAIKTPSGSQTVVPGVASDRIYAKIVSYKASPQGIADMELVDGRLRGVAKKAGELTLEIVGKVRGKKSTTTISVLIVAPDKANYFFGTHKVASGGRVFLSTKRKHRLSATASAKGKPLYLEGDIFSVEPRFAVEKRNSWEAQRLLSQEPAETEIKGPGQPVHVRFVADWTTRLRVESKSGFVRIAVVAEHDGNLVVGVPFEGTAMIKTPKLCTQKVGLQNADESPQSIHNIRVRPIEGVTAGTCILEVTLDGVQKPLIAKFDLASLKTAPPK